MKRYEYRLISVMRNCTTWEVELYLNKVGSDGWQLTAMDYGCFIMMREITDAPLVPVINNPIQRDMQVQDHPCSAEVAPLRRLSRVG